MDASRSFETRIGGSRGFLASRLSWPAVCLVLACGSADAPPARSQTEDSAGVQIVLNTTESWTTPWSVVREPVLTIGSIDGDPDHELDRVTGALRLPNGILVVANSGRMELLFFDTGGTLIRRSGGRGQGPGEFESLERIARFPPDSLVAFDAVNRRVSYFDSAGRFGRSVKLASSPEVPQPHPVGFFSDGSFLATKGIYRLGAEPPTRVERTEEPLFRVAADGESATVLGVFPGAEYVIAPIGPRQGWERRGRPFGHKTACAAAGDRFFVADNESYEIRVYSSDGVLSSILRLDREAPILTQEQVKAFEDSTVAARPDDFSRRQMRALFRHMPPPPERWPAHAADLVVDTEMNLWVRESSTSPSGGSVWSVFTTDGRFLGSVPMPANIGVFDVGPDYVIGLRRDEWHVEYVEIFELLKGA